MAKKGECKICRRTDRAQIEMLNIAGASLDSLETRFNLGRGGRYALHRHMHNHVSAADRAQLIVDLPLAEMAAAAAAEGMGLLDYLKIVRAGLMQLYLVSLTTADAKTAVSTAGRLLETLRDIASLTGELVRGVTVTNNIQNNNTLVIEQSFFVEVQDVITERLAPWPEARKALADGLRDLHGRRGELIEGRIRNAA